MVNTLSKSDNTIPWTCLGSECPQTCCGPFHGVDFLSSIVTPAHLGKIIKGPHDPPEENHTQNISIFAHIRLTPSDVDRLLKAGLDSCIVRRGDPKSPSYYLRLNDDKSCSMLTEDKLCGIYESRPTICRAFPFYYDLFAGLCMVKSCPGIGKGETKIQDLSSKLTAAEKMYTFWLGRE